MIFPLPPGERAGDPDPLELPATAIAELLECPALLSGRRLLRLLTHVPMNHSCQRAEADYLTGHRHVEEQRLAIADHPAVHRDFHPPQRRAEAEVEDASFQTGDVGKPALDGPDATGPRLGGSGFGYRLDLLQSREALADL